MILEDHKAIQLNLIAESITLEVKIMYIVAIPLETNGDSFDWEEIDLSFKITLRAWHWGERELSKLTVSVQEHMNITVMNVFHLQMM